MEGAAMDTAAEVKEEVGLVPRVIHVPRDYVTLAQAVQAARDGDEVVLAPGTYDDTDSPTAGLVAVRSNITLRGTDRGRCRVSTSIRLSPGTMGAIRDLTVVAKDAVKLVSANWHFENCTFVGTSNSLWCGGSSRGAHLTVKNCSLEGNPGSKVTWAVFIYGDGGNFLDMENCEVRHAEKALTVNKDNHVTITGGIVEQCTVAFAGRTTCKILANCVTVQNCDVVAEVNSPDCSVEIQYCDLIDNGALTRNACPPNVVVEDMPIKSAMKTQ